MRVPCCVIAAIHFYFWILWLLLLLFFFFLLRVFFCSCRWSLFLSIVCVPSPPNSLIGCHLSQSPRNYTCMKFTILVFLSLVKWASARAWFDVCVCVFVFLKFTRCIDLICFSVSLGARVRYHQFIICIWLFVPSNVRCYPFRIYMYSSQAIRCCSSIYFTLSVAIWEALCCMDPKLTS